MLIENSFLCIKELLDVLEQLIHIKATGELLKVWQAIRTVLSLCL